MLDRPTVEIQLPVYEGPLDLLLRLIERAELDITKVSLAQVTDQYLTHLRAMQTRQLAEIAEFMVIAARLLMIKSEALLPRPPAPGPSDEADDGEALARQLRAYKLFKEVAGLLGERQAAGLRSYLRLAPPPQVEPKLDLSYVTPLHLLQAAQRALARAPDRASLDNAVAPPNITIRDRIEFIRHALRPAGRVAFQELLASAASRMEIVVTFLAVLELIKRRWVVARQESPFGEILILAEKDWGEGEEIELEFE